MVAVIKSLKDIDAKLKEKGTKKEETEQIDEIAVCVCGAGLIGAGLAAYKAISGMRKLNNKLKKDADTGKGALSVELKPATDAKNKALGGM